MKTIYLKTGGLGEALEAIWKLDEGVGIGYTFKGAPTIIELQPGDQIVEAVEITKKEFNNHQDAWKSLVGDNPVAVYCRQPIKEIVPFKTTYYLIWGEMELIGYSSKSKSELSKFFQDHRGGEFEVLDENRELVALIGPEVSATATYVIEDIV